MCFSTRFASIIETHKDNIMSAVPYMRKITRKNVQAGGFTGCMYAVGLRTGYEGVSLFLNHCFYFILQLFTYKSWSISWYL